MLTVSPTQQKEHQPEAPSSTPAPGSEGLRSSGPCAQAQALVYGDRNASYGEPLDDMGRTAQLWSAILGVEVTAEQVAMCMICVKLSRLCHAMKADSVTDICGYSETIYRMQQERKRRQEVADAEMAGDG